MTKEEKVKIILQRLYKVWPNPKTELNHANALELLFATILSAQTLDKQVNKVTPALFSKFKSVEDYARASVPEIETLIRGVNFYKNKARYLVAAAQKILNDFDGKVPDNIEDLTSLPGVARKTANVVLGDAFGKAEGIVVDTHVRRLARCFGLTTEMDPVKIERDLMEIVPKGDWTKFSHLLILFGRYHCPARLDCCRCPTLGDLCKEG